MFLLFQTGGKEPLLNRKEWSPRQKERHLLLKEPSPKDRLWFL